MANALLAIMCGLPLSGKSTYVDRVIRNTRMAVVCPDDLRLVLTGQEFHYPAEQFVWGIAETFTRALLKRGQNVVVDATNATKRRRAPWIKIAKECEAVAQVWYVATSARTCEVRAEQLEKTNLLPIIERQSLSWETPLEQDEGIPVFEVVSPRGELIRG